MAALTEYNMLMIIELRLGTLGSARAIDIVFLTVFGRMKGSNSRHTQKKIIFLSKEESFDCLLDFGENLDGNDTSFSLSSSKLGDMSVSFRRFDRFCIISDVGGGSGGGFLQV
mmetsp:Transcript_21841/g.45501  ORF Transcript_21841/g.45501 Transcript_21841/m.45501 type:complete len:113 (-) Transcript_21841:103-441(-)